MSAEPKVLLEFEMAGGQARIVRHESLSPIAEVWDHGCRSWLTMGVGDGDADTGALAVYDALEARHARVREAVQEWAKVHGGKYDCECMACHFLRRALEDSPIPPLPGTETP